MIVTLTPNPSIDRTVTLAGPLERGAVQRLLSASTQGGGKGVNISRAAVRAGIESIAVLPAAQDDPFVGELMSAGIRVCVTPPAGPIRINLTITEPDGTTTKLNSPGPTVNGEVLDEMAREVFRQASESHWVVLAGSLPPGAPATWYAELVSALKECPAKVAVDTSGAALQALVDALPQSAPDLMKPNGEELASFTGGDAETIEHDPRYAVAAAQTLIDRGVGAVLVTLGARGAVLVTPDGAWQATPPPISVVSTVGAGDSSLFGYVLGETQGLAPEDRLALAVAYGSAAASLPGTTIPSPVQTRPDLVRVQSFSTLSDPA
jgi:1-phosphofructokinase